jgi:hypothetical protein
MHSPCGFKLADFWQALYKTISLCFLIICEHPRLSAVKKFSYFKGLLDNAIRIVRTRWKLRGILLLAALALAGVAVAFALNARGGPPRIDEALLRDGDMLFVRGSSLRGLAVVMAEGGFAYAHVGMIRFEDGRAFVIHASPGGELVQEQSLTGFLSASGARHAAVYRLGGGTDAARTATLASERARTYFDERRPFDNAFSLADADSLYCTELVWRAYLEAGTDLCDKCFDTVALPFIKEPVVLPSSLLRTGRACLILETE